ncbi:DUF6356 family protein [Qipengyuania gelatinilytica]|uniref:Capsule biosynthesis protein n=1 Tax=Qipengyuania gelatinilytica TaxID=2867231 RepID=A0ABX9A0S3_9SPHN|nr:DUF6356 family protein [Qipengyuania gelatinilytica]QZD94621.1 hypothetical protein K3136_11035 [Qipengyuania gelatinilytica]
MSIFTDHPHSVGESYFQHLVTAGSFGVSLIAAGFACLVHGIFPFLCKTTGSRAVRQLADRMIHGRERYDGNAPKGEQIDWCI